MTGVTSDRVTSDRVRVQVVTGVTSDRVSVQVQGVAGGDKW